MKLAPISFTNFKQKQINQQNRMNVVSFQAKQDSFESTTKKPTAKEVDSAFKTIGAFFGINLSELTLANLNNLAKVNPNLVKYTTEFGGINLLNSNNIANKNETKYKDAIKEIQSVGYEKLTTAPNLKPIDSENPTLWSLTSEFAPIKEGGLGVVPPAITKNAKKVGVNVPTFIPMYLQDGVSNLTKVRDTYTYTYKGEKFEVQKAAKFDMDIFQNGESKSIPVEVFVNNDGERQLVFLKCENCFDGSIYEANQKVQEPEKFAIFSKAIYELAKLKTDKNYAPKNLEVISPSTLKEIKEPDGMILNDWQASPYAALARYRAPLENACGALSDEASYKLKNMNIITIGHNAQYQGLIYDNNDIQRKNHNTNVLNTLFDKFAYDIVSNAKTGSENFKLGTKKAAKEIDNVMLMKANQNDENYVNLLNIGVVLSDYFCPVSQNYANELTTKNRKDLSYDVQNALIQKANSGRLKGVINGNDFDNLSIVAKKEQLKKQTGVEFKTYEQNSAIKEVEDARLENKINLYNNFILPFSNSSVSSEEDIARVKDLTKRLEFVESENQTELPVLSDEELANTPILTSGGRLVSQKGVDILCDSIKTLFDNWEKDFPNKNKPIIYIAGADGEGGEHRKRIETLKAELGKDSNRVIFMHGFAPVPALMAGSDFFLMTSKFEPCGLTQSESLALATPVIANAVGGIVDTVNRNGKENGILTDKNKPQNEKEFYAAMKKGLNIYFDNKKQYSKMVKDSLAEDFSWIQPNKQGPIYDYMNLIGAKTK
ncbi:glycogen/starch synthase [bacterium]|nr:glycogen/starch synthase [bacterium]